MLSYKMKLTVIALLVAIVLSIGAVQKNRGPLNLCYRMEEPSNIEEQVKLGHDYVHGRGVKKSYKEANNCYRRAAEQGNTEALNSLGWSYYRGFGVETDHQTAFNLWRKAKNQGDTTAQKLLEMYEK